MKRIHNKKLVLRKSVISIYKLYGGHSGTDTNEETTVKTSSAYHEPTEGPAPVPSNQTNPQLNSLDPLLCN
ncbi:MAG: hypothetical protein AAF611_20480 [Bacteroidota bacterium]